MKKKNYLLYREANNMYLYIYLTNLKDISIVTSSFITPDYTDDWAIAIYTNKTLLL